ncbi:hypothetical protein D3C84_974010 [compost metagenome]
MELRQGVVRHHRVHVVLKVIVHVHVQKAQYPVHIDGAAVATVVQHVFRQAHMLGEA